MSPNNSNDDNSFSEETCVVCFKNVDIYSVGDCDHPVCHQCSTKMRVLCKKNECPICRHDMQKVGPMLTYPIAYKPGPYKSAISVTEFNHRLALIPCTKRVHKIPS